MRDVIGTEIVQRVAAVAFVECDGGRALGDVIEEVAIVRGGEHHVGALGNELPEGSGCIGGVRNALDEHRLQFWKGGLYGLHSLVVAPGPAFVGDRSRMAESDDGLFLRGGRSGGGGR